IRKNQIYNNNNNSYNNSIKLLNKIPPYVNQKILYKFIQQLFTDLLLLKNEKNKNNRAIAENQTRLIKLFGAKASDYNKLLYNNNINNINTNNSENKMEEYDISIHSSSSSSSSLVRSSSSS